MVAVRWALGRPGSGAISRRELVFPDAGVPSGAHVREHQLTGALQERCTGATGGTSGQLSGIKGPAQVV